jgi:hypothetical protein
VVPGFDVLPWFFFRAITMYIHTVGDDSGRWVKTMLQEIALMGTRAENHVFVFVKVSNIVVPHEPFDPGF